MSLIRSPRFPLETETYKVDQQFLLGGHVLLSPVLYPQKEDVEAYVPNARWFDYYTGVSVSLKHHQFGVFQVHANIPQ